MRYFLLFILYFLVFGFAARWLYFLVTGFLQVVLGSPFMIWAHRKEKRGEAITDNQLKPLRTVGIITTFIVGFIWTFVVGGITLSAINAVEVYSGWKWLYIIAGFYLALLFPRDEDYRQTQPQLGNAMWLAVLIGYPINAIIILYLTSHK